jgi:hypothetical protein
MSDRLKLAREIAGRTTPRFIDTKPEPRGKRPVTSASRFIEIRRQRGGGGVPFTDEQLTAMRGGLTAEEYRWQLIRDWE